jgi:hypothetical protein
MALRLQFTLKASFVAFVMLNSFACTKTSQSQFKSTETSKKTRQHLPAEITAALKAATSFELISLNPDRSAVKTTNSFYGWPILGSSRISLLETKDKIIRGLEKAAAEADGGSEVFCFNPRHGIRAKAKNKDLELVICFECLKLDAYLSGKKYEVTITDESEGFFNRLLRAEAVKMPPSRHRP